MIQERPCIHRTIFRPLLLKKVRKQPYKHFRFAETPNDLNMETILALTLHLDTRHKTKTKPSQINDLEIEVKICLNVQRQAE